MEFRKLGKSGLQVSAVSLGSWLTFGKQIGNDMAEKLMDVAFEKGINFFDTAEVYAHGQAETVMGEVFKKKNWSRESYVVATKVYFGDSSDKGPNKTGLSRKHIFEGCNNSLRRLQLEYVDLFFCHRPDKNTPIAETVWAMNHLIQQGKILYWGTSEWSAQEIMEAHMVAKDLRLIGPTMEQPQYNMFERAKVEVEYNQIYKTVGLGTTIWSPLSSGVLTDKYIKEFPTDTRLSIEGLQWLKERSLSVEKIEKVRKLNKIATEMGVSLAKLSIAWCLKNENVSSVILGASKVHQLEETISAVEIMPLLTPKILNRIENILKNKPEMPQF